MQPFILAELGVYHVRMKDKVGAGVETSDQSFALRFGGGLEYCFSEHVVAFARATYLRPTDTLDFGDYVSFGAGMLYRF